MADYVNHIFLWGVPFVSQDIKSISLNDPHPAGRELETVDNPAIYVDSDKACKKSKACHTYERWEKGRSHEMENITTFRLDRCVFRKIVKSKSEGQKDQITCI